MSRSPNHARTSVIMRHELDAKVARVAAATNTSKNAVLTALVAQLDEIEMGRLVVTAMASGLVNPIAKRDPHQKELLERFKQLPVEELQRLMSLRRPAQ